MIKSEISPSEHQSSVCLHVVYSCTGVPAPQMYGTEHIPGHTANTAPWTTREPHQNINPKWLDNILTDKSEGILLQHHVMVRERIYHEFS